VIADGA